jgi:hypothetical protein
MLDRETQAALVNMSMDAETVGYCSEIMSIILPLIQSKQPDTRSEIMQFLYCHQGAPLRLFFEIMRYLPSVSNEPIISYKIK